MDEVEIEDLIVNFKKTLKELMVYQDKLDEIHQGIEEWIELNQESDEILEIDDVRSNLGELIDSLKNCVDLYF